MRSLYLTRDNPMQVEAARYRTGALNNQLQHLGEVKVLGWKKQKSYISS